MKYNKKKSSSSCISDSDQSYFLEKYSHTTQKSDSTSNSDKSYFLEKHSSISCSSTVPCKPKKCKNIVHIPIYYPNNYWYKVKC